jgi:hypothetical protein
VKRQDQVKDYLYVFAKAAEVRLALLFLLDMHGALPAPAANCP